MNRLHYPPARRTATADVLHGRRVPDPYRWLEDGDGPACTRWLTAQEELYASCSARWPMRPVFRALLEELTDAGCSLAPVTSPPVERGTRRFFLSRAGHQELPVLMTAQGDGPGRVLVDPLAADPSGATTLDFWRPSWTGRMLSYQLFAKGSEEPLLYVLDVDGGIRSATPLRPGRPSPVAWLPDDSGFYYVAGAADAPSRTVRLHLLDSSGGEDAVVFETRLRQLSVSIDPGGKWLAVSCAAGAQAGNAVHLADLTRSGPRVPQLRSVYDGTGDGTQALVRFGPGGRLYAITTRGAPGGRVCLPEQEAAPPGGSRAVTENGNGNESGKENGNWTELITLPPGQALSGCVALTHPRDGAVHYLVTATERGSTRLVLYDAQGERLREVPVPGSGPATLSGLTAPPGETDHAWFVHTDFLHAPAVHRFTLADRSVSRPGSGRQTTGGGPTVRQVTYRSDDGTEIPMYLVHPPGSGRGPRPTLLTAYGGFGLTAAATYSPAVLAWVKAGGTYAIAGVRGGGEKGAVWHAAGRGRNKPNAFADFAAAARWLIREGWTTPRQLAVRGSSHSGLTVAVAITRDPALYAAAVCSAPLTDMVRFPGLGLGAWWLDEFGDPDDPHDLDTLLGYSPYHHVVAATPYPAVLLTGPRRDPRVGGAHLRKFAAALQFATGSTAPVLLRTEDGVGHGGTRAVSGLITLQADTLAFCAAHTGLVPDGRQAQRGPA
ncbi:prolyl oligopeptidase family serine peptidase [Streptomyces sp. NPDC091027]|uniref:prolyl oligopeptidase family serine peptidase n=1 Tax=Streptomyces sp. NPDC091027 TaxID=3365971 RepID=UPI0037F5EF97